MFRLRSLPLAAAALVLCATTASAQAGLQSNVATVSLSASKVASLTVTVNSGGSQTLATLSDNAVNTFTTPVNITTAWDINPSASSVVLLGYFSSAASALANGAANIASGLIEGRMASGTPTSWAAFTQNGVGGIGAAGSSLELFAQAITGANKTSSRTDDLELRLNLTGQTTTAGTYTGTLNLRAVTQ